MSTSSNIGCAMTVAKAIVFIAKAMLWPIHYFKLVRFRPVMSLRILWGIFFFLGLFVSITFPIIGLYLLAACYAAGTILYLLINQTDDLEWPSYPNDNSIIFYNIVHAHFVGLSIGLGTFLLLH